VHEAQRTTRAMSGADSSVLFHECAQVIARDCDFSREFDKCGGLKNRRRAQCKMSIG
jgi:hypothetical protein